MKIECYQQFCREYSQSVGEKILKHSIFAPEWQAKEEMLLLCQIQKHGFGNWQQIAQKMKYYGSGKSKEEIQRHYLQVYIDPHFPIHHQPAESIQKDRNEPQILPFDVCLLRNIDFRKLGTRDEYFQTIYNPKRQQFIEEQTSGAQGLLVDLEFHDDDSPFQREIKLDLIEQYNRRVEKRQKIKGFIIDHRLFEYVHNRNMDLLSTKFERNARECFGAFRRVMSWKEYQKLVRKIGLNDQINVIIAGLHHLQESGINIKTINRFQHLKVFKRKVQKKQNYDVPTMKKVELLLEQWGMSEQGFKALKRAVRNGDYKLGKMEIEGVSIGKE